ncbi:hypothetical protein RS1P1_40170 [Pseudomonas moraviensis]|nr:hypothetical protein RS1P1_40170 [Pseudomonas moraviensis]
MGGFAEYLAVLNSCAETRLIGVANDAFASRLAPTGGAAVSSEMQATENYCGSEPAREEAISITADSATETPPAVSRASS